MILTHFDDAGQAQMVDITDKTTSKRMAIASGRIVMNRTTMPHLENNKKGDVLAVARIAGIQAAKHTAWLIPLCHPIALGHVTLAFELNREHASLTCRATAECTGATGVEMEALTAVSVALLTVYDMLKAVDKGMLIEGIQLLEKQGGRSGLWQKTD